jgi:predicted phosphodiesterase
LSSSTLTTSAQQDTQSSTTNSSTITSTTPPTPEVPSAIVAFYADSQSDTDQEDVYHQNTVNHILSSGANPVFHAGDLMEDGTQDSLNRFNNVTATLRSSRNFYAALGNNDRKIGDSSTPSQLWLDNFVFPNNEKWYSVNYGNLHVVVLDSAFSSGSPSQLGWLASDLQSSASQSRITCVMFHHPTFSDTISSYLINNGVDFVITGHYHSYQHSIANGINYFVLSGQTSLGYMVAKIYSDKVHITVYNNGNGVVDSIDFNER